MPGFFGDSSGDEGDDIVTRPVPRAARAGPSTERQGLTSPAGSSSNGRANRRQSDVEMDTHANGFEASPARSAIDHARRPPRPQLSEAGAEHDENLVARLARRWVNEREAPELLMHQEDDLEEALLLMRMQSNAIASIRKVETDISEEEHFRFIVVQQDMERVKYIIKNYVRTRQSKMERFADYLLQHPEELVKLTPAERDYLQGYHRILSAHLQRSVLDSLPEDLRQIDRPGMYPEPNLDKSVHILVRRPCGPLRLPGGQALEIAPQSQHFLRYRTIREVLSAGDVQLL